MDDNMSVTADELLSMEFETLYIISLNGSHVYHLAEESPDYPPLIKSLCNMVLADRRTREGTFWAYSASQMPIVLIEKPQDRRLCYRCSIAAKQFQNQGIYETA